MKFFLIGIGGFMGSIARHLVSVLSNSIDHNLDSAFPYSTLIVNFTGCLLLGLSTELLEHFFSKENMMVNMVSIGFIGAYTTFSTFSFETIGLMKNKGPNFALLNVGLNVLLGLSGILIGLKLAIILSGKNS